MPVQSVLGLSVLWGNTYKAVMKSDYAERKFTVMWLEQRLLADLGGGAVDLQ